MTALVLHLLSGFQAEWNGAPITAFESNKVRALLVYLAVESGRPHLRSVLAGLLWPDYPEEMARTNLRHVLRQLRQTLSVAESTTPFLLTSQQTIQLNPAAEHMVDVNHFAALFAACQRCGHAVQEACTPCIERYRQAAELYRGDFLAGLSFYGSEPFEAWALVQREQLHQQALAIFSILANLYEARGDDEQARQYAWRQLALEPWCEEAHRQLMRALARSDQRSAALAQYAQCRKVLAEELGVEPDAETVTLYEQIRAGKLDRQAEDRRQKTERQEDRKTEDRKTEDREAESRKQKGERQEDGSEAAQSQNLKSKSQKHQDWGEAPATSQFYGRLAEVTQLQQWLLADRCRLVVVLGMGGMGKTTLAVKVAKAVAGEFEFVFWRSLLNVPPLTEILHAALQFFAQQQLSRPPDSVDGQFVLLCDYLRQHRCLLVLDNVESILEANQAGQYRPGYAGYGQLIERMARTEHQSCLLLTSRERPLGVARMEEDLPWVRSLPLYGLAIEAGEALLKTRGLSEGADAAASLVARYSGNPLALKLVARTVQELFEGDVAAFLSDEAVIFDDIRAVLDQQFARLSALEQEILLWLAVEREGVSLQTLTQNLVRPPARRELLEGLRSLQRRSLLEKTEAGFTLQNVVIEYLTDYLVDQVCRELKGDFREAETESKILNSHALLKAQAKEYIRQSQTRLLLAPIATRSVKTMGQARLVEQIRRLLDELRAEAIGSAQSIPGYTAANLLHLLLQLKVDLRAYNFSGLSIWQTYLRGVSLPAVNLAHADLSGAVFTDTFRSMTCVTFSPQRDVTRQLLAAGSGDGTIRLWQVADRQPCGVCTGHTLSVWSIAFSPDGQWLASASEDSTVRLWNAQTGHHYHTLHGHTRWLKSVTFSPDGARLASCGGDGTIRLWDVQTGELLQMLQGHNGGVWSVAFCPDGHYLASGGEDSTVRIWDAMNGNLLHTLQGHRGRVTAVAFQPRSNPALPEQSQPEAAPVWLASSAHDGTVRLWDAATGEAIHTFSISATWVNAVVFSPDGALLASGSHDPMLRVWEVAPKGSTTPDGIPPRHTLHGHAGPVAGVAFSPNGRLLASVSDDHSVRLWDAHTGQVVDSLHGYPRAMMAVTFCLGGTAVASAGLDRIVRVWDAQTGQLWHTLSGHTNGVRAVAASPDGTYLASGSLDYTVRLWDAQAHGNSERGEALREFHGHTGNVMAVAFSSDGTLLASGSIDRTVRLWDTRGQAGDVRRGQVRQTLRMHRDAVLTVAFSPDGTLLATGGRDRTIYLSSVRTGETVAELHGHTKWIKALAFSPDGALLASGSDDDIIHLWDVKRGAVVKTLTGHTNVIEAVAFSPRPVNDRLLLASGSYDGTVRLWDADTGDVIHILHGHTNWLRAVAFGLDGLTLASSSDDETVRLWAVQTGVCLHILHAEGPYSGMIITGVTGISKAQQASLMALGAVDEASD